MPGVNSLFFSTLSNVSPEPIQKWRFSTKTSNLYNDIMTMEMLFTYIDNTSEFNLTSSGPNYDYMTLFHMGTGSTSNGLQVVLVRRDSDSNPIEIGIRYQEKNSSTWEELSGSFINLKDVGGIDNADESKSFYIMVQYDYTTTNNVNFYIQPFIGTTTTPSTVIETTSGPNIQQIGGQWGFGASPESITSSDGYISTNGYNSFISQNLEVMYVRVWNTLIPVSSSTNGEYAMYNNTFSDYSLYNLNRSNTYVPANTTNLNFQLYIPDSNQVLSNLGNNAVNDGGGEGGAELVTLTDSTTGYPTLADFALNDASGFNIVTASRISCIQKGANILTTEGYKRIEELTLDDILKTHDNREIKIKKIKVLNVINKLICPYKIKKGEYGASEDFYLSKYHALLIDNIFRPCFTLDLKQELPEKTISKYYLIMTERFCYDTIIVNNVVIETWGGTEPGNINTELEEYENINIKGYNCRILKNYT